MADTQKTLGLMLVELRKIRAAMGKPPKACAKALADLEQRIRELERRVVGPRDE